MVTKSAAVPSFRVPALICALLVGCTGDVTQMGDVGPDGGTSMTPPGSKDAGTSMMIPTVPGEVDPNAPPDTNLPPLPALVGVQALTTGDSVRIEFDPINGAADYRVYALPAKSDVSAADDGHITIQNAVYRCAGQRQAPHVTVDGEPMIPGGAIRTLVDNQNVDGYTRSLAEATLGYVYTTPGEGRVPVYAMGDHDANADADCFFMRFTATRMKRYVSSESERATLLAQGFRDDGIAFYVPAAASADTVAVSFSVNPDWHDSRYYFVGGAESATRKTPSPAFQVLKNATGGAEPLMRVFHSNMCGASHDELVVGPARFERVRRQGPIPLTKLHWSGLTGPTTLVVEALDQGCPFPGLLGYGPAPAYLDTFLKVQYQPVLVPSEVQAASPTHELYINGQFEGTSPRPIARSFIKVAPTATPDLDWSFGFSASDTLGDFVDTACGVDNCYGQRRMRSDKADIAFFNAEDKRQTHGVVLGEWWVSYSDLGADTNGKYRLTPIPKGDMAADSYLYVTMEVDSFSTKRRYPQFLISDRDAPVQNALPMGNTIVVQTFSDWPYAYELQVCDHKNWDVNDQCPRFDFYRQRDPANKDIVTGLAPNAEVAEQTGLDFSNRFEAYVSTKRAYLFLDGKPYGCANLPAAGIPSGAVTVTYGDVLYHSDADTVFDYAKEKYDSFRHFDNLGFKSHVAAPAWDEARFPCASAMFE